MANETTLLLQFFFFFLLVFLFSSARNSRTIRRHKIGYLIRQVKCQQSKKNFQFRAMWGKCTTKLLLLVMTAYLFFFYFLLVVPSTRRWRRWQRAASYWTHGLLWNLRYQFAYTLVLVLVSMGHPERTIIPCLSELRCTGAPGEVHCSRQLYAG